MLRRNHPLRVAVLCSSVLVFSKESIAQPQQAQTLLREGVALRRENRDREALDRFQRAYQLQPQPIALAQIALAEQALGRWVVAEQHLREALSNNSDEWIQRNRSSLEAALNIVQGHLASIEVNTTPEGAEVLVRAEVVARTPMQQPVRIESGADVPVEVRREGSQPVRWTLTFAPGSLTRREVRLTPIEPEECPQGQQRLNGQCTTPVVVVPRERERPVRTSISPLVWAGIGVGGAGLLALGIVVPVGFSISSDWDQQCTRGNLGMRNCDYTQTQNTLDALGGVGVGSLVAIGAGATLAIVGAVLPQRRAPQDERDEARRPPRFWISTSSVGGRWFW